MKRMVMFFCLLPFLSHAQNWRCFSAGDTVLFSSICSDTTFEGIIRPVAFDSVQVFGSDTVFFLYPSVRLNGAGVLDTLHGDTWIGKRYIQSQNGWDRFMNRFGDTIHINTLADLGSSWTMYDSAGFNFQATVLSTAIDTIEGVTDSVKVISFQAYQNSNTMSNHYNSFQIILSKEHGVQKMIEVYGFPWNDTTNLLGFGSEKQNLDAALSFERVPDSLYHLKYTFENNVERYVPGNEWQYRTHVQSPYDSVYWMYHDSIMSVSNWGADSLEVVFYQHKYSQDYNFKNHYEDTLTSIIPKYEWKSNSYYNNRLDLAALEFEGKKSNDHYYSTGMSASFMPSRYLRLRWMNQKPAVFYNIIQEDLGDKIYMKGLIWTNFGWFNSIGFFANSSQSGRKSYYIYIKLGPTTLGTEINFRVLNTQDFQEDDNKNNWLFPNPATTFLQLNEVVQRECNVLRFYTMDGNLVLTKTPKYGHLDISELDSGVYAVVAIGKKKHYTTFLTKR